MRTPISPIARAASLLTAGVVLTACGSQLDPNEVASTQQGAFVAPDGTVQSAAPGSVPTDGSSIDPGTGTDPGSGTDPGAAPGTGPGADTTLPPGSDPGSSPGKNPSDDPTSTSPTGDVKAGDCSGFKNQTGITDSEITIANASDISGPVPGLFEASQQGTQAFVAYFNATQKLCGRSLKLENLDSRADAGGDQQAYTKACSEAFAVVGSTSSQDSGGAATAQNCGIPDIRAFNVTPEREHCSTCFAAYAVSSDQVAKAIPDYFKKKDAEATQHVAIAYVDIGAASTNAKSFQSAYEKDGMKVDLMLPIAQSEFNYAPYVQQMKDKGIQFVQYFGPYQFAIKLQQAMQQNSFKPPVYLEDPTIYDDNYLQQSGGAGDGSYVYSPIELFTSNNPEMKLYLAYLNQVAPGAKPNYYGLFAWSAARLFVEEATKLGGKLTRASLVADLKTVKGWTDNGTTAPMAIGAKSTSPCIKIIQLHGSSWSQTSPGDFTCGSLIETGVGG